MSCAAREVIQFLGYALDESAVSPAFAQMYFAGAGLKFKAPFREETTCKPECHVKRFYSHAPALTNMLY
ncbi:MAG TPA: hypothetical protein VMC79_00365 [Rectinemataceae bacterium]|nr:hypothetical protein [Rectinemataceae bacterium]